MREDVPLADPGLTAAQSAAAQPSGSIVAEPRWDVYYAVVFAASLAIVQAGPLDPARRVIATAALAAMVPWYIVLGRPLMKQDTTTEPRATIYLAGLVVLFAIAQSQAANAWLLAFGLLPMCFHVTTARRAMVFVVIINVIGAGLDIWRDPGLSGVLTAPGGAGQRAQARRRPAGLGPAPLRRRHRAADRHRRRPRLRPPRDQRRLRPGRHA
jgi:hypothetical protein